MTNAEQRMLRRFDAFHRELDRLAKTADGNWTEGGMTWRREFLKRGAKSYEAKHDLVSHFDQCVHQWSILLWHICGCPGIEDGDMDISANADAIHAFEIEANRMLSDLCPQNGSELVSLRMESDDTSIIFEFVFVAERHAMRLRGMWSID